MLRRGHCCSTAVLAIHDEWEEEKLQKDVLEGRFGVCPKLTASVNLILKSSLKKFVFFLFFFTAKFVKIDQMISESNSPCLHDAATIKPIPRLRQKVFEKQTVRKNNYRPSLVQIDL